MRHLVPYAICFLSASFSQTLLAHAEHDKARFVAQDGQDSGACDRPVRACKTIGYAASQANKGDRVLVAQGHYQLKTADELFYLTSKIVPVLGGYNKYDHFLDQAPQVNPTILSNVPDEFKQQLQQQGFVVINDGFALRDLDIEALQQNLAVSQQSQGPTACVNGKAGVYPCNNIDLVSHVALADISLKPSAANDIWGHVDLNTGIEYAIIGLMNGTAVFSLANPEAPVEVGSIAGTSTSWRDIKVLQTYDATLQRWQAYAYVSSEGSDHIQILDLNHLPTEVRLVASDQAVLSAHNVYISHVDYSTNTPLAGKTPLLHIVGQNSSRGAFSSYQLTEPTKLTLAYELQNAQASDYTHDGTSLVIDDARASRDCGHSSCSLFVDFNEKSVRLWDISTLSSAGQLAELTYPNASYVHSGWWTEDKRYVLIHDELDERNFGLPTTVRVMQIDSLKNPQLVGTFTGPTAAIDHNGFTRGNRYYMSNYQRGTTVLNIADPAAPVEAGFFDSFPNSNSASFNGVWGTYPYLPSGLIISSDINSGLFVLRDQTKQSTRGQLHFSASQTQLAAGVTSVSIEVQRPSGSGAVSVGYETLPGFGMNLTAQSGRLSWAADDLTAKAIQLNIPSETSYGSFFVKLLDPQQGATLGTPSYHTVTVGNKPAQPGQLGFAVTSLTVDETSGAQQLSVERMGGDAGSLKVAYQWLNGTAKLGEDVQASNGELSWADGDSAAKSIPFTVLDDTVFEGTEQLTLQLTAVSGSVAEGRDRLTMQIRDNEVNQLPQVQVTTPQEVNAGATVTLAAVATDADGDTLSYRWLQQTGTSVTLQNANSAQAQFVAPLFASNLSFSVTVTDSHGGVTEKFVAINVIAANTAPTVRIQQDSPTGTVNSGQQVQLSASVTDAEGGPMQYQWQQLSGPSISLTNSSSVQTSFVAPTTAGTVVLQFTATDSGGLTGTSQVSVTISATPTPPAKPSSGGGAAGFISVGVLLWLTRQRRHLR